MNDYVERMRNGEKIKCPKCKEGYFAAVGDPKTTKVFRCDFCKLAMVLTIPLSINDKKSARIKTKK